MSKAEQYRALITDIAENAELLEPEERMELVDMLNRIERKMLAKMPEQTAEAAE